MTPSPSPSSPALLQPLITPRLPKPGQWMVTFQRILAIPMALTAIALLWLVCSVIAAFKAWNGEHYRDPLTIRLF